MRSEYEHFPPSIIVQQLYGRQTRNLALTFDYIEGICRRLRADVYQPAWELRPVTVIGQVEDGCIDVETDRGETWRIESGCGYFMPANVHYRYRFHHHGRMIIRNAHVRFLLMGAIDLLPELHLPHTTDRADGRRIGRLCEQLFILHQYKRKTSLLREANKHEAGFRLLSIALRLAEDRADFLRVTGELERLKPVIEYVEAHLAGALKLRDLAAIAHLSEPHLHTVFRRIVGQSPMAFVHDQRLKRARLLLSTSDQPIKAVAASCGYPDPFHFSRTFRAAAGLSPREYRARSRNHLAGPA